MTAGETCLEERLLHHALGIFPNSGSEQFSHSGLGDTNHKKPGQVSPTTRNLP